ncbi:hypothetical protein [Streptomyces sp. NPDC059850]|uniref:hypothetical protein n=1 Tax=Streptomyces sp. NPDC059850 TaxID=3346970 RepID=UPI00365C7549
MGSTHIIALPVNDDLPKAVHADADEWRRLDQRVDELTEQVHTLKDDIRSAEHADAQALADAAVKGGALPDNDSAAPIRRTLAQVQTAVKAAEAARAKAAESLVIKMRRTNVRDHLAAGLKQRVDTAADAYETALADAEATVNRARAELERATLNASTVQALDDGWELTVSPAFRVTAPEFSKARQSVADVREAVDGMATAQPSPQERTVRLTNGKSLVLDANFVAQLHGKGEVAEWLDGYGPETPIAPPIADAAARAYYDKTFGGAA